VPDSSVPPSRRPVVDVETVALLGAVYVTAGFNRGFLETFLAGRDWSQAGSYAFAAALAIVFAGLHLLAFLVLFNRWTAKPLLTAVLALAPAPAYFMSTYGVLYDRGMMANAFATDTREAGELLSTGLFVHVAVFGMLPIALLWWVKLRRTPRRQALRRRAKWTAAVAVIVALVAAPFLRDLITAGRANRQAAHMILPTSVVVATVSALRHAREVAAAPKIDVGADARAPTPAARGRKPRLLVIVVGETARAANWGLGGYARQTTPRLAALDVVNFADASSCGTSTEVSLPCMFSPFGRRAYDETAIRTHRGLLHVLDHAGIAVLWRDNQPAGCKGVCDDLPTEPLHDARDPDLCENGRCFDEILLRGLEAAVDARPGDAVIALHQLGNHGPAYFERYPPAFRRFEPTCDTSQLGDCTDEAIVNTYDNALLYTDHLLAEAIGLLKRRTDRETALIYLSDHGESLGEYGLYLHGMPYAFAPEEQTHIPLVMWLSEDFREGLGIDRACLEARARRPASHDDLFGTVLGMMQVSTSVYDPATDVTAGCRSAAR
jgi:lipid A ethanolaminephosphotransferase